LIPQFGRLALTGNFTHCFYLDLLAGSGLVELENNAILPGSALVALAANAPTQKFEMYYFVERDTTKAQLLDQRLSRVREALKREYVVEVGDCNAVLPKILKEIYRNDPEHSCFLALLDPEGYTEIGWETIQMLLGGGKGDLIFNFTEGVARNVQNARQDTSYVPSLQRFFAEPHEDWIQCDGYDALVDHFSSKFQMVNGIKRTTFRIDVADEANRPLYALIIATGSTGYANIVRDLKKRLDATKAAHLRNIYDEFSGKSKPLTSY
jgi:three-Cys-motif partner protein